MVVGHGTPHFYIEYFLLLHHGGLASTTFLSNHLHCARISVCEATNVGAKAEATRTGGGLYHRRFSQSM